MKQGNIVTMAPLKTIAPECRTTDSGRHPPGGGKQQCVHRADEVGVQMPFGSPVVPLLYITVRRSPASTRTSGRVAAARSQSASNNDQPAGVSSGPASASTQEDGPSASAARTSVSIPSWATLPISTRGVASDARETSPDALSSGESGTAAAPSLAQAQ